MTEESRRQALKKLLAGLLGLAAGPMDVALSAAPAPKGGAGKPVVARARRKGVLASGKAPDPKKLDSMLGRAVATAVGESGPVEAFRSLFRPRDVVGIKLNCLAGRGLSPHPELVARLTDWLQQAGVPAKNIVVWERSDRELEAAGFRTNRRGNAVRCYGTNDDYDWTPREWGHGGSCFARPLVDRFTALINVGVLKDHDLAGVSIGMKNWYGVIHNPNKHHDNGCDPYVAELASYPLIRDRLRLTVIDGLTAQCHGGPARSPRWTWPWEGVLASTDQVALDAVGWAEIEKRRHEMGLKSLAEEKRAPKWIATAAKLGLGEANPTRIRVEDV